MDAIASSHAAPPDPARPRLAPWVVGLASIVGLAAAVLLPTDLLPASAQLWVENLAQLFAAAFATAMAAQRVGRSPAGRERVAWILFAVGCLGWTVGQGLWSWFELIDGISTPFPALSDYFFLTFTVCTIAALLIFPFDTSSAELSQRVLDAGMVVVALGLVSWMVVIQPVVGSTQEDGLALALLLAYPLGDVAVVVITVLAVTRIVQARWPLLLIVAGLVSLSVSDSAFAYLVAVGDYDGGALDLGWVIGFLLIAVASAVRNGSSARPQVVEPAVPVPASDVIDGELIPRPGSPAGQAITPPRAAAPPSRWAMLPYLTVTAVGAVMLIQAASGELPTFAELGVGCFSVVLLLIRQYLVIRENNHLAGQLASSESLLRQQAFSDALTGLPNRALFRDRLAHALDLHARDLRHVSVLFLDLDDFKVVNDTLGHARGDELLVRVSERLRGAVRTGDTVARLGGDEFGILMEDSGDPHEVAGRVLDSLRTSFVLDGRHFDVGASIGVFALQPEDVSLDADLLLSRADTAMYSAKRSGKRRIVGYQAGMQLRELDEIELTDSVRDAVDRGRVTLVYQPIVDLQTGRLAGLEALARLSINGEAVSPETFLRAAHQAGQLGPLTKALLDTSCGHWAAWTREAGFDDGLRLHVNVAPSQIVSPDFPRMVSEVLAAHRVSPRVLMLEITETGIFADSHAVQEAVSELRGMGISVALDDFGSGYSALSHLQAIRLDAVKIDRSCIDRMNVDPRQETFLRALMRLAGDLDLEVIAEGVERPEQLAALRRLGCTLAQGFLLGRPIASQDVLESLANRSIISSLGRDLDQAAQ